MLKQTIVELANHLQNETHLYPLMDEPLTIEFRTENDQFYWQIGEYEIVLLQQMESRAMVQISGLEQDLLKVLLGFEGLQGLSKRRILKVAGRYKHILRLESILYCGSNVLKETI